jgi:hypothetical protein
VSRLPIKYALKHRTSIKKAGATVAMYEANLSNSGHTRRFQIKPDAAGWEVREEEDSRLVSARVYNDWHRVERARSAFQIAVLTLKQDGWTVDQ